VAAAGEPAIERVAEARTPVVPRHAHGRAVLRWFGIDTAGLDPTTPCSVCGLPAAIDSDRCPSHAETVAAPAFPGFRLGGVIAVAATLGLLGVVLGTVAADDRFAWIGALAAASQVAGGVARQLHLGRVATAMGMVAFFTALTLIFAGLLVATIAALPLLLQRVL